MKRARWCRIPIVCAGRKTMFVTRAPSRGEIVYLQEMKMFSKCASNSKTQLNARKTYTIYKCLLAEPVQTPFQHG